MNSTETIISKKLANNSSLRLYNDHQFLDETILARQYAKMFGIMPDASWYKAFKIVTEGQGNEFHKINSLISSSLLSLLMFHKLFLNTNTENYISIKLSDIEEPVRFDKCFFEVRNRVVRLPSCVDVLLYSSENNVMLFLESKFTEYTRVKKEDLYGKGYITLYTRYLQPYLDNVLELGQTILKGKDKLRIKAKSGERYIEGVKQSISHLIGLTRGPHQTGTGYYPDSYHNEYSKLYNGANKLYYGIILFDLRKMNLEGRIYEDYVELYNDTVGRYGDELVQGIREWDRCSKKSYDKDKQIEVLCKPLSYQDLFQAEPNNRLITNQIKEFYHL